MECVWEFPVERIFDYINNSRILNNSTLVNNNLQIKNNKNKNFMMQNTKMDGKRNENKVFLHIFSILF